MLCAVDCIELAEFCEVVQRGADGGFEFGDARFHAGGAFHLGDVFLVLLGRQRACVAIMLSRNTCSDSDISAISSLWPER